MTERRTIARELSALEQGLKELEIAYEQYFAGVEKREPMAARARIDKLLRRFSNRKIVQTDLRFKYQTLAARFHSYATYWDRILRLMDEGRYQRQIPRPTVVSRRTEAPPAKEEGRLDQIYQELLQVHRDCNPGGPVPDRLQLEKFLENQERRIREKFGEREVEFKVSSENGKPKLKVRAKK